MRPLLLLQNCARSLAMRRGGRIRWRSVMRLDSTVRTRIVQLPMRPGCASTGAAWRPNTTRVRSASSPTTDWLSAWTVSSSTDSLSSKCSVAVRELRTGTTFYPHPRPIPIPCGPCSPFPPHPRHICSIPTPSPCIIFPTLVHS